MDTEKDLLPWYINGTLEADEERAVELWLERTPEAKHDKQRNQQIAHALLSQKTETPSPKIQAELFTKLTQSTPKGYRTLQWAATFPIAILLSVLLWIIVQPGNQLSWSTPQALGTELASIRIYRAPTGSTTFQQIDEFPVSPDQQGYQYFDTALIPLLTYQYIIEMVDHAGKTTISQPVSGNIQVLFGSQIAILLSSCILAYGFITATHKLISTPSRERLFLLQKEGGLK